LNLWIYARLVILTAGTLLPFFWMVVILGHRRQRNFERVLFFLCLALVFYFGASLLALNTWLYYPDKAVPLPFHVSSNKAEWLLHFSWILVCIGLWFLPSLLVHLHLEYARVREIAVPGIRKNFWVVAAYLPAILFSPWFYGALRPHSNHDFALPANALGRPFQLWLVGAILLSSHWQGEFAEIAPDKEQRSFHRTLKFNFLAMAFLIFSIHAFLWAYPVVSEETAPYDIFVALLVLEPFVALIRKVQKFNFLQIGHQRNLIYAVFTTFLALLYLSFVRRVSTWAESYLPPEATAAILLFLPVVFFEPLQRLMRRLLQTTAQTEMDRAQRLMGPILEVARLGDLVKLQSFIENWVTQQLQLAGASLSLEGGPPEPGGKVREGSEDVFNIGQAGREIGRLRVESHGAMLSGETLAALQFLCEQLPGALDLCRLIEEKLQLERELAERERLAVLGQMAASISHNLKNPLGSIKTILQVQMENPELPESMRGETKMVLEEIGRLSSKLNQLLQFSRPAVRGGAVRATCDARAVAKEVSGVLRHEAERRGLVLEVEVGAVETKLAASSEAVSEILSNLVVNALEATARGGQVKVRGSANGEGFVFAVEDDGPGVPESVREKILQPFFTTKTQGSGLGLAIVARRVAEFGGSLVWESPLKDGRGTRFTVNLPMKDRSG
jgi:signal transduction histidine kinase